MQLLSALPPPFTMMRPPTHPFHNSASCDYHFCTGIYPQEEQFERLRTEVAHFKTLNLLPGAHAKMGFQAQLSGWTVGAIRIWQTRSQGLAFARTLIDVAARQQDGWALILRNRGWGILHGPNTTRKLHPGQLELRKLDRPYHGYISEADMTVFYLQRDMFHGCEGLFDQIAEAPTQSAFHPLLARYMRMTLAQLDKVKEPEKAQLEKSIIGMIRACITLGADDRKLAERHIKTTKLEVAKRYIDANIMDMRLSMEHVRLHIAVSRRHLYELFEEEGGIFNYMKRKRFLAAYNMLANPKETLRITDIAEMFGYAEASGFSKAFKQEFGCSPSDVRAVAGSNRSENTFIRWLNSESKSQLLS